MSYLVDSHCHLHDREFFSSKQAEEMIKRAHEKGVEKIICIGTNHEDSLMAQEFAKNHENVYWTYGIHPEFTGSKEVADMPWRRGVRSLARRELAPAAHGRPPLGTRTTRRVDGPAGRAPEQGISDTYSLPVAIGEVGLDYHYDGYDREAQIKLFEEMLQLAIDNDLPLSFHVREAFDDFFSVVANFPKVRGVVHSFSDNKKNLKKILNITDFYVGVNGMATYSTLPMPPLERIILETDAPFLTPKPFRGIINEPAYVSEIALWLGNKLGLEYQIIERETTKNAEKLFKFQHPILRKTRGL